MKFLPNCSRQGWVSSGKPATCRHEEKNMAPNQYSLNFGSESTGYSFYQDIVFSSPELHADEVFNTLPLIKALVYKHILS